MDEIREKDKVVKIPIRSQNRLLTVADTLKKKRSDFAHFQNAVNCKNLKNECPECGSDVLCAYADQGVTDFFDSYRHLCRRPGCRYIEKHDEFWVAMGEREYLGPIPCPFCGRDVF